MKKCIIVGAGTYGQVYAAYLSKEYDIVGFIDDNDDLLASTIGGIRVLGNVKYSFDFLAENPQVSIFVPLGDNILREKLLLDYFSKGYQTPTYIHPEVTIHENVEIGLGVYILPGTNIMPYTIIEDFVMISMGVNIAHHNIISQGCFFSQGVNIGASVKIEQRAYFGIGSTLMTGVKNVGKDCLIGAGSVIIRDVPSNAVVVGNPGKILKYIS